MNTDLNSVDVPQIDSNEPGPEKPSIIPVQTGLRAGLVRPEEAFIFDNWGQIRSGLDSFFDRLAAGFDIF